jgi:DNA end-binding protein Ku
MRAVSLQLIQRDGRIGWPYDAQADGARSKAMARPIWKGHISFGLVNVPVILYSGEQRTDISFHLIDSRNSARIRYERVNEETGREVPWDKVVKGFEYSDNNYVLLSDEELERASVEMTRTIEIEQFVDLDEIDVRYFERPYILVPDGNGEKGYVLLREAIADAGKAGIARVVIRARQHLAALIAYGDALILELLRFSQELRGFDEYNLPGSDLRKYKISKQEIDLAAKLVDGMTADWNAAAFEDKYRSALMKLVEKKIESGETEAIEFDDDQEDQSPQTINFMDVLKQSVAKASEGRSKKRRPARKTTTSRKRPAKRKRAS